jgi:DNA-binding GntR family transcriptional regulator
VTIEVSNSRIAIGRRQQLPDEAASYVRELIISGKVRPGEILRLDSLAKALGVSSTPVREGLLSLTREGFVSQEPRRGFVVAPFTRDDIRDLFWTQAWLSGELAARAAVNMTPERLERLDQLDKEYVVAHEHGDMETVADLGHAFHREINLAGDSVRLASLLGSVVRALPLRFYSKIDGTIDSSLGDHPALVEVFRERDPEKARSLMEEHITRGADLLIRTLEVSGLWSGESPN